MFDPRPSVPVVLLVIAGLSYVSGACSSSCAAPAAVDAGTTSPLTPDDGGALVCYAKSCPRGYGDCPGSKYLCDTDLSSDPQNCGSCGNACPDEPFYAQINVRWICSRGQCEPRPVSSAWADCDERIEN